MKKQQSFSEAWEEFDKALKEFAKAFCEPIIDVLSKFLETKYEKALNLILKTTLLIVAVARWVICAWLVLFITLGIIDS